MGEPNGGITPPSPPIFCVLIQFNLFHFPKSPHSPITSVSVVSKRATAGEAAKMGRCGTWRNPAEPDGTPRNTQMAELPPQFRHFSAFFSISRLAFPRFLSLSQYPTFRWFRNVGYWALARKLERLKGKMGKRTAEAPGGAPGHLAGTTEEPNGGITPPNPPISLF